MKENLLQEERHEGHTDNQKVKKVKGISAEGPLMKESSIHSHLSNTQSHIVINVYTQNEGSPECSNPMLTIKHLMILHMANPLSELKITEGYRQS